MSDTWYKHSKIYIVILFFLFSPFYDKSYWEKEKRIKHQPYYPEELFVFSLLGYMAVIGVLSLYLLIFGFIKYREIEAFNKVCNANISYFDGIFLNLRIDSCLQKKEINNA